MHLVLDPAQDAAHGDWLRQEPGAYEWWYFDAISDDHMWSLACIWFLGNPFSPYYRLSAQGTPADPYTHNALFFALHRHGALYAYHFTQFPRMLICADEHRPASLRFGPNQLDFHHNAYHLALADENANRRVLNTELIFTAPFVPPPSELEEGGDNHFWLPAAPDCRVSGEIRLRETHNAITERIVFRGHGYHDHNWGTLPFAADIHDWYWARAALGEGRSAVLYHVNYHPPKPPVSHLLLFEKGRMTHHDPRATVQAKGFRINVFGTRSATLLEVQSGDVSAQFHLGKRLDSSPFYIRTLSQATVIQNGQTMQGQGMAEYFRPKLLGTKLVASATKARIVGP